MSCCRRRPSVQPVQFVCLRCSGPLMTVITALATYVSLPATIGGCVGVLHCRMYGDSVHDTSSKGFVLLSLRWAHYCRAAGTLRWLSWWRRLISRLSANRLISAVTMSILRSLWKSAFQKYQGALTMFLRILFWNLCIMVMLFGFVHPHSCMS